MRSAWLSSATPGSPENSFLDTTWSYEISAGARGSSAYSSRPFARLFTTFSFALGTLEPARVE